MRGSFLHPFWLPGVVFFCWGAACSAGLVFEKEKIEVSPAPLDKEVSATYTFRNTGTTPVKITRVVADCSCTTPKLAKESYAPGETGELDVKFDISRRQGSQKRTIIASTDDPATPRHILTLTAELPQVMTIADNTVLWLAGEELKPKTLVVKTSANPPVQELRARPASPLLQVQVERANPTEFRVVITPPATSRDLSTSLDLDAVVAPGIVKSAGVFVRVR